MTTSGTTGVLGQRWRAEVTSAGAIDPWDGSPTLDWHVAADDRWHSPAAEVAVRQTRVLGGPVFETRLRVPGGDVVHRAWSVADDRGLTVVELVNDSPLPIACALTRTDLLTSRPPTGVPIQGIDLDPATTTIVPIGHRGAATVALPHDGRDAGPLPGSLPSAEATARGWVARAESIGRVVLPDERDVERLVADRCEVLLAGPPPVHDDPVGHLLALGQLVRSGELHGDELVAAVADVADAIHAIAARTGWDVDAAIDAGALVLARAGERRAVGDVARIIARRAGRAVAPPVGDVDGVRAVAALECSLVTGTSLFPSGIPVAWRGSGIEVHGLPAGPTTTVSWGGGGGGGARAPGGGGWGAAPGGGARA
ncbi:MAG: hypothetical protein ABW328_13030, partial [Ilumatobacteraceae bacterium]